MIVTIYRTTEENRQSNNCINDSCKNTNHFLSQVVLFVQNLYEANQNSHNQVNQKRVSNIGQSQFHPMIELTFSKT